MTNQPDNPSQTQQNTCVEKQATRSIAPEHLRKLLSDHRNRLKDVRWNLLAQVKTLEREIAACDAQIADLIME